MITLCLIPFADCQKQQQEPGSISFRVCHDFSMFPTTSLKFKEHFLVQLCKSNCLQTLGSADILYESSVGWKRWKRGKWRNPLPFLCRNPGYIFQFKHYIMSQGTSHNNLLSIFCYYKDCLCIPRHMNSQNNKMQKLE